MLQAKYLITVFLLMEAFGAPENGFRNLSSFPSYHLRNKTGRQSSCEECIFPFKLYDDVKDITREYNTCVDITNSGNYLICATKVGAFGYLEEYAFCDSSCPGASTATTEQMVVNPLNAQCNCYCGVPNIQNTKIIGGNDSATGQFPWQVALLYEVPSPLKQECGGTLVSDRYVLSAAHCTFGEEDTQIYVNLGDTILGTPFEVQSYIFSLDFKLEHPGYNNKTLQNDISILKLSTIVDLYRYPNIKPACLPQQRISGEGVVSGWGLVNSIPAYAVSQLQYVKIQIFPEQQCENLAGIFPGEICAGILAGGKDSCDYDSGGPLVAKTNPFDFSFDLAGIVSSGEFPCAQPNKPGLYVDVFYYLYEDPENFLNKNMPDFYSCPRRPSENSFTSGKKSCNPENTVNGFVAFKNKKNVRSMEECKNICDDNEECQYFHFKDSKYSKKRTCFLLKIDAKNKKGFFSGSKGCSLE